MLGLTNGSKVAELETKVRELETHTRHAEIAADGLEFELSERVREIGTLKGKLNASENSARFLRQQLNLSAQSGAVKKINALTNRLAQADARIGSLIKKHDGYVKHLQTMLAQRDEALAKSKQAAKAQKQKDEKEILRLSTVLFNLVQEIQRKAAV